MDIWLNTASFRKDADLIFKRGSSLCSSEFPIKDEAYLHKLFNFFSNVLEKNINMFAK